MDIYVSDLAKSVAFWGPFLELLGWRKGAESEKAAMWKGAGVEIFFVQTEPDFLAAGYHRKRVGLNHLAFAVKDRRELDAVLEQLRAVGVKMLYRDGIEERPTQHRLFFEDPDRIKVEVVSPA